MKAGSPNADQTVLTDIDKIFTKRAILISLVLHTFLLLFKVDYAPPELKPREDAIKVDIATPEQVEKNKFIKAPSPFKENQIVKTAPVEKLTVGTEKVVPNADRLGNPKADKVQEVQKGDPMSKNMTAYKQGKEFRKLKKTNIGTGARGKEPSKDGGGGSGDTYKGFDFASKSDSPFAKKGYRFKVADGKDDGGAGAGTGGSVGDGHGGGFGDGSLTGTSTGTMKKAEILNNVGSLSGASKGKIASSKGAEGLSQKGAIMMAGIPTETVVLGSIDPETIRALLREHIPQFRRCYQSELDRNKKPDEITGILYLNFVIGASGRVISSNVKGDQIFNASVKDCVTNVLQGIPFPAPKGSGNVEVKQPINFYPQRL
ncbi:MAG: AgmX/PglI C-terminal domain-containing protein [Bacteriovoracaceae bacterium]